MKNLIKLMLVSFFAFLATAGLAQDEFTVASDQNAEVGDFENYSTFTFAKQIDDYENNQYFWESKTMKSVLKNEIRAELQAMGYEYVEGDDAETEADLVVNFHVLEKDAEVMGWENTEPATGYWGFSIKAIERDPEDRTTYDLKKGTIMINLADVDEGIEVWRGFASGIIDDVTFTQEDEVKIGEAVTRIFEEFHYTASR